MALTKAKGFAALHRYHTCCRVFGLHGARAAISTSVFPGYSLNSQVQQTAAAHLDPSGRCG